MSKNKKKMLSLLVFVIGFVLVNISCEWPWGKFKRNPNLRLLRSEGAATLFSPVCSPYGKRIYYIKANYKWLDEELSGPLRSIDYYGAEIEVKSGNYCAIAISPDGSILALVCGTTYTGGRVILIDTLGNFIDTLSNSQTNIIKIEFSRLAQKIYFLTKDRKLYRINVDGTNEEYIKECCDKYFSLTSTDSIIESYGPIRVHPQDKYLVATQLPRQNDLLLINRISGDTTELNANPYKKSMIDWPYWSSDGKELVFTAAEVKMHGHLRAEVGELWVLEKVFE